VAENTPVPLNRTERVLAAMIASIAGLSVLAIIAVIAGSAAGVVSQDGAWPVVVVFPSIGLPVAFVLIIVFAVVSIVRRRRLSAGN
jgi:hypothetical protein